MSHVVTIRLDHGKANTLDAEQCRNLLGQLDAAESRASAVILTAGGTIFSAGLDLFKLVEGGEPQLRSFLPLTCEFFLRFFTFSKPLVAAVNGHALAGGCVLALCCDYRLMADSAGRIGLTELAVGVPFPTAILEIVRFAVPQRHLQEVNYFAKGYEPAVALSKGLIDEVVPSDRLLARATEVAQQLAAVTPDAFRLTKLGMREGVIQEVRRKGLFDEETMATWIRAITDDRIRAYAGKAIGKNR